MSEEKKEEICENSSKQIYNEKEVKQGLTNGTLITVRPPSTHTAPFWEFFDKIATKQSENEQPVVINDFIICKKCNELFSYG